MHLSWNEVRSRAAGFAKDWREAAYEKGETQSFYNAFFEIFGVKRRSVARYEQHVRKLDNSMKTWPAFPTSTVICSGSGSPFRISTGKCARLC